MHTCVQDYNGVLLFGPLKQLNLVFSRAGNDLLVRAVLKQATDRCTIQVNFRGIETLANFLLVLDYPGPKNCGISSFLFTNFAWSLWVDDESMIIQVGIRISAVVFVLH